MSPTRNRALPPLKSSLLVLSTLALVLPLRAEDLGGGAVATNGKVVRFSLEKWIPGQASRLFFERAPATTVQYIMIISSAMTSVNIPGFNGTLVADIRPGSGFFVFTGSSVVVPLVPQNMVGLPLIIQGCIIDQNGQGYFTDATKVDVFNPTVMVGNQRQSANSISVIDLKKRQVVQKLGNSENGRVIFHPNRKWAYVTEPGSGRNYITPYDLTGPTITPKASIIVTGGIRYGCAISRLALKLYCPMHNAISVVDINPGSPNFHREIGLISVPITGSVGSIFTGPLDLAINRSGTKLYIAYGEQVSYPAKSTVGVVDLTKTPAVHKAIPVTTGGTFIGLATRWQIVMAPDDMHVYTVEWGVDPTGMPPGFILGFTKGAMINVINTLLDQETKAFTTGGFQAQELAVDRMGRNLWIAQLGFGSFGEILRVDVDWRSSSRFSIMKRIQVSSFGYATGAGPIGIDVTPDGATVCFTVSEGAANPTPEVKTLDAATNALVGAPITVESLPSTLSITQY